MSRSVQMHAPATLQGPALLIARVVWIVLALFGVAVNITTLPTYYHNALGLHATGCCVDRNPAEWRIGLHQLGLTPTIYADISLASQIILASAMLIIGVLIFWKKSNEWIGLFVSIVLVAFGLVATNTEPAGYPMWLRSITDAYVNAAYFSFFIIPLVFPDGRFVPRWSAALVAFFVVAGVGQSLAPDSIFSTNNWPAFIALPFALLTISTILFSPVYRYRRLSDPVQREQTKWVMFSLVLAIAAFFLAGTVIPAIPGVTATPVRAVLVDFATQTILVAFLLVPIGFAVAILRYRLWDIDALINRTLVYGSLTLSLVGLYIGAVIALQALFSAVSGQSSDLAVAIATLGIAAISNPWRYRLQAFIDRRFYRRKYDAARTLAAFNTRLRDEVNMDELSANLLSVAHDTMQPASVALWLRETKGGAS